ncbi:YesL family protein [Neobacillus drentensis]|uniref:YesL family protein n=1 Tax=Neobacillus drentensis TaxID=220684 RepID=UPI0030030848
MNRLFDQFNVIGEWLFRIMLLNLLWLGFTLLGGVILGFFPATVSLFAVMRKWIRREHEINTFKFFIRNFKNSFVQANILGLVIVVIGILLAVDLHVSQKYIGIPFIHFVLLLIILLYSISVLFFFSTFVHYELKTFFYLIQSFFMSIIKPLYSLLALFIFLATITVFYLLPVPTVLFAGPMLAYPIMWIGNRVFTSFDNQKSHKKTFFA